LYIESFKKTTLNYLGHLFLSDKNLNLMLGNLLGDFVKGSKFIGISDDLQKGIILHRKIDMFIDHHPLILDLQSEINDDLPKVSGIAIDLIFDHLLAKKWSNYSREPLHEFLNNFYDYALKYEQPLPENYRVFLHRLKEHNFILQYIEPYALDKSSEFLSNKLSFPNKLKETRTVFENNQLRFQETFDLFMKEAIEKFIS
jgi:acyl carrier protein phosphodiesterase